MSSMSSVQRYRSSMKVQRAFGIGMRLFIAFLLIIFSIFPVLWVLSASLNPTGSLATQNLIPKNPGLENYKTLFTTVPYWTWFFNSIKVSGITAILSLSITTIAAYAFSRFRFRHRQTML